MNQLPIRNRVGGLISDKLFDDVFRAPFFGEWPARVEASSMVKPFAVDLAEEPDKYLLHANLPGVSEDKIEITFEDGVLTISVKDFEEKEDKNKTYHIKERRYGSVSRSFSLPNVALDGEVDAKIKDGVLNLSIAKQREKQPRKIEVKR